MNFSETMASNIISPKAFLLGSNLISYPDEFFAASILTLMKDPAVDQTLESVAPTQWKLLRDHLHVICHNSDFVRELGGVYIDLFERSRPSISLYETEYGLGRSIAKGNELLDIATFYSAFGMGQDDDPAASEMVDHIGVELEFYGLMRLKLEALSQDHDNEGVEIVAEGCKNFMQKHLSTFTRTILNRPELSSVGFYHLAMHCIDALISQECLRLGIERADKPWEDRIQTEEEELSCGAGGCLSGRAENTSQQR